MALHPVLQEKLAAGLEPVSLEGLTRRDVALPAIRNKVHTVLGMRRVGKTTFLQQVQQEQQKILAPERAVYLSFDDDRLADLPLAQLDALVEEYYRSFPQFRGRQVVWWFFDEIQVVSGWERFIRRLMDTEKVTVVVSGSSARLLSREVHTSLRGRGFETIIRPFSFREFLRHRGEESSKHPSRLSAGERSLMEKRLQEYLEVGGFPEAQGLGVRLQVQLLQSYVDTLLLRDVVERYQVSQIAALRWIARMCLRNPAGLLSAHGLYRDLKSQGHAVSKDTVHALLEYLVDAFLVTTVPLATESERRRNANPRKVYPADPGLIRAFDSSGRANLGHALETAVLNELERRGAEIGYVKTDEGFEVDFHARVPGEKDLLIQVCADISAPEVREREFRALHAAASTYRRAERMLLVLTHEEAQQVWQEGIRVVPAYQWFLEETCPNSRV
ncbi:MAG: ATP-binding protein [Nitrospirae bacterium]|nr:MAG: ATP-binding protein [Nitrospirota bacterium]